VHVFCLGHLGTVWQLRGYFLPLYFTLSMQLPHNVAHWNGQALSRFSNCQWVELLMKLANMVKVAPHGTNQQDDILQHLNQYELYKLLFHKTVASTCTPSDGLRLDDRHLLFEDMERAPDVWRPVNEGAADYLAALIASILEVDWWNGEPEDVPGGGPLMRVKWAPLIEEQIEEHRRLAEKERRREAELNDARSARLNRRLERHGRPKRTEVEHKEEEQKDDDDPNAARFNDDPEVVRARVQAQAREQFGRDRVEEAARSARRCRGGTRRSKRRTRRQEINNDRAQGYFDVEQ